MKTHLKVWLMVFHTPIKHSLTRIFGWHFHFGSPYELWARENSQVIAGDISMYTQLLYWSRHGYRPIPFTPNSYILLHIEIGIYLRTYLDILFIISWHESRFYTFSNSYWKGLLCVVYIVLCRTIPILGVYCSVFVRK